MLPEHPLGDHDWIGGQVGSKLIEGHGKARIECRRSSAQSEQVNREVITEIGERRTEYCRFVCRELLV